MRLGLLVFATDNGLGNQTRVLHNYLKPTKTMLLDISFYNRLPLHEDWYEDVTIKTNGFPTKAEIDNFLEGLDIVFFCETPLNYYLIEKANQLGVATICQYNYEFCSWLSNDRLPRPTIFAGPTLWNKNKLAAAGIQMELLPVPLEMGILPQRTINQAKHFFHIAGRPAINDRNGSLDFIRAVRMLALPDARYTIYCQKPTPELRQAVNGTSIELVEHLPNYADMYSDGDVMILPRRYGGLCMVLNEAIGSGIPVLMPDIDPNNTWLPREWLVPVLPGRQQFMAHTMVDLYSVNVERLVERMSDLYHNPSLVVSMHEQAKELAKTLAWEALHPRYEEVIEKAVKMVRR